MIKTMIFDLGGVLINFSRKIVAEKLSKYSNLSKEDIYNIIFKSDVAEENEKGKFSQTEFHKKICNLLNAKINFEDFKIAWIDITGVKKENIYLIHKLKQRNYRLLALSNTDELNFEFVKNKYREALEPFDEIVLSYKIGFRKPNKKIFEEVIRLSNCKPKEIVFIDDLKENIYYAKKLGINGIHFENNKQLKKELTKLGIKI